MGRRIKRLDDRPCELCEQEVSKLTRARLEEGGEWLLICDACWDEHAEGNPDYTYGGVWKA